MKTTNLLLGVVISLVLPVRIWAGNLSVDGNVAVNSNLTAQSMNVGGAIDTTNATSLGVVGDAIVSALYGDTNIFGILLSSSNAIPRVQFIAAGDGGGGLNFTSTNLGMLGSLWVRSEDQWLQCNQAGFRVEGSFETYGDAALDDNLTVNGKTTMYGGMDPPYLLLDAASRTDIVQRVGNEIPSSKQAGAVLFWNSSTKRLEIYVAGDSAFYDLSGNVLATAAPPQVEGATVTTTYRIDPASGQVLPGDSLQVPHWRLKTGYMFDPKTGAFSQNLGQNVPPVSATRDEALEFW